MLDYLKSPKGSLGKTAGCFSLLAKDAVATQLQPAALPDKVNIEQMSMEMKMRQKLYPLDGSSFAHR